MAAYTRASMTAALKDIYEDKIGDLVLSKSYFLDSLEKAGPKDFPGGDYLKWLVDVTPNTSYAIGNMDGGVLPDPGRRTQLRAAVDIVDHDGSTGMTQDAIDRARGSEASFFRVVEKAKDDLVKDLRKTINPQLYKQQSWAVTADSSGTTLTLDSVQNIRPGAVLTFGNRTTGAGATTRTVVSRNIAAKTIVVDAAVTGMTAAASGAWLGGAGPADTLVMESLDKIAGTSRVLHGIDSAAYPVWDGNVVDVSSGGNPTVADEDDVISLVNKIWERDNGEVTNMISTIGVQKRIAAALVSQKRFNDAQSVNLHAGYKGLLIAAANNEVPLVAERDVPKGRLYAYDKKALRLYKGPQEFIDPNGNGDIWRYIYTTDGQATSTYAATYRLKLNLIADNPQAVGKLIGATDDNPPQNG